MMTESQALETLTREDPEAAGDAKAALACRSDSDCDDRRACNGKERCAPRSPNADARGCVKGTPVVCPVNQVCGEGVGCRGIAETPKPDGPKPDMPKPETP